MYNYYVCEVQTPAEGPSSLTPFGFTEKGDAEDKFLNLRMFARQSTVMIHTVMFIDNKGNHIEKPAVYIHPVETGE